MGVLVDQHTHAVTHRVADYEPQEPLTVKGKSAPVLTWVAARMRSRFGVGIDVEETAAFVGRDDSLRLLIDSYERASQSNAAQLVTISGEPGVGKTRLVSEFRRVMDERSDLVWWRQGHCLPYGDGISFWALGEIVKAHAGVLDGEPTETVRSKVLSSAVDLIESDQEASWVGQRLLELIGIAEGDSSRTERFSAWTQFLETLASRRPLVMVIDDLHWADSDLVEFLDELVERVEGVPLLLVATARPELYDGHPSWGGGKRNSTTIALGPLSEEDTAELVGLLDEAAGSEDIRAAVQRSGGNPLYATELVRMGADREASGTGDEVIPESIHAVIASRIDLLAPEDKELLQAASVVGKVFWSGAVAFATGKSADELDSSLRRLSRKELIRRARRSSIRDQDEYSFWHDLVADVSYGQIPRQFRRDAHEAVGNWIEATAGERTSEVAEILAHHFSEALELSQALGEDDNRLVQAARRHLLEAGRRIENLNATKASGLFDRALDLSRSPAEEAEVLIRLTIIVTNSVGGEEAVTMGKRALVSGSESGDVQLEAQAATVLSRAFWVAGDGDGAHRSTRAALDLAEQLVEGPVLTDVLSNAIGALYLQGDHSGMQELIDRALDVGQQHGPRGPFLNALKWSGTFLCETGGDSGRAEGIEELQRAYAGSVEGGFTQIQITTANNLASMLMNAEDMAEAIELCETAIAVGTARGLLGITDFTRLTLAEIYWHFGRWDEVARQALYLIDTYPDSHIAGAGGFAWLSEHQVFTKQPGPEELVERRLGNARRVRDHQALVPALGSGIELHRQKGEFDEAMLLVHELEKLTEDRPFFRVQGLMYVTWFLEATGEWDVLERLLDGTSDHSGGEAASSRGITTATSYARGIIALSRKNLAEATKAFEAALEGAIEGGSPWQQALVVAHQAAVHIERDERETAVALLDRADELLEILGGSVFDDYVAEQRARL